MEAPHGGTQTGPEVAPLPPPAKDLLSCPDEFLDMVVSLLDAPARGKFFGLCKGTEHRPGTGMFLLKTRFTSITIRIDTQLPKCLAPVISWAALASQQVSLRVFGDVAGFPWQSSRLQSLLVDEPNVYTSITSLDLKGVRLSSMVPGMLCSLFPNLTYLDIGFWDDLWSEQAVVLERLPCLQRLRLMVQHGYHGVLHTIPFHLIDLHSLTSIELDALSLEALRLGPYVAAQLTQLTIKDTAAAPSARLSTTLTACTGLHSVALLRSGAHGAEVNPAWLQMLRQSVPQLKQLHYDVNVDDEEMATLLSFPELTSLRLLSSKMYKSYTDEPCTWRSLSIDTDMSHVAVPFHRVRRLPLHTLDTPVYLDKGMVVWLGANHADSLARIKEVQPHLSRCGGLRFGEGEAFPLSLATPPLVAIDFYNELELVELLEALAPCIPELRGISIAGVPVGAMTMSCLAQYWGDSLTHIELTRATEEWGMPIGLLPNCKVTVLRYV